MATAKKTPAAKKAATTSTAVAVSKPKGGAIVDVKAQMAAQLAALAERTMPAGGNKIRVTQGKKFILPDGTETPGPIEVVIVDFAAANMFYDRDYKKDEIIPPACYALGHNPRTLIPMANSPAKQADDCASCPNNEWQSGKNGGKACSNKRILAVLQPGEEDPNADLWVLEVSPTGLKSFDSYVNNVARQLGSMPVGVITTVSLDENSEYATLRFSDPQPNPLVGEHMARQPEAQEMLQAERDVSSYVPLQAVKRTPAGKSARR